MSEMKLKAHLSFDEEITLDECGNTWTATGSPTISNGALQLNGSSWLKMTEQFVFTGQPFTIACDFSGTSNTAGGAVCIWQLYISMTYRIHLSLDTDGTLNFWAAENKEGVVGIKTSSSVLDGQIHHAECSYADSTWQLYLDGVLVGSQSYTYSPRSFALYVGTNYATGRKFTGTIDEFQVYQQEENEETETFTGEWRVEDKGNAQNVLNGATSMEVSKTQSITGVAFWGGSAKSPAFDIPADVKEIWLKFDLYLAEDMHAGDRFSVGHYMGAVSQTTGKFTGIWNGIGLANTWDSYKTFLIDAYPVVAHKTGITGTLGAINHVCLHMKSDATNGLIKLTVNGTTYTYTGNVNNGSYFNTLYFYSSSERVLFSNIIVSNKSVRLYENIGVSSYFDVECEIENDALGWRYEDVALYVGTGAPLNFHVPRAYELWIRFDVYFDGVNRWYAYCEGVTGIIAIEPATLVFMSRDNVVNQVEDACKVKQSQTILLHMKSGTSDGVIEVWSGYEKIGEYTGNVNDGAAFGDFILRSDGAGTSFTELIISNEEIQPDEKPSNAVRATKTSMLTVHNRKTYIKWSQPGGIYPRHYIKYNVDEVLKKTLTETDDSGEPVLIEIKSIWFKFDVYSDGSSTWRAYADGSSGKSGMSGLISRAVKLFANDADTDQFENICKANQWQTFILHMYSDATEGLIEAQVDGGDIYRWTGNVNNGEEFTDVYLTSDNDEVTFQNFIVSTAPLDFGDAVSTVAGTPATEKIFFNVRHQGEVLSVPFVAESATPAVAIRWQGRDWFNQLVSPDDVDASTVTVRHGNEIYALSFGTFWRYVNAGTADDLIVSGTTLTDLPESQSRTGTAFYQTTRTKCFDLPATPEIWLKFDVYFDGSNRWRAYNGGDNDITGITAQTNGNLSYFSNGGSQLYGATGVCKSNQLQTVLLHMISGSSDGVIEAWVDGSFIYRYTGDVNHGEDFADIYLQSDGAGTFFSNLIISNAEIK